MHGFGLHRNKVGKPNKETDLKMTRSRIISNYINNFHTYYTIQIYCNWTFSYSVNM